MKQSEYDAIMNALGLVDKAAVKVGRVGGILVDVAEALAEYTTKLATEAERQKESGVWNETTDSPKPSVNDVTNRLRNMSPEEVSQKIEDIMREMRRRSSHSDGEQF